METDVDCSDMVEELMERYDLDEDAARALADAGTIVLRNVLSKAGSVGGLDHTDLTVHNIITEHDVLANLKPFAESGMRRSSRLRSSNTNGRKLPSCGDGSCLFTSLRTELDLVNSYAFTRKLLEEGKTADDTEYGPCLSGDHGSENHASNYSLRKLLVGWFCNPPSNLDLELPESYGITVYEEKDEEGILKEYKRPMTRMDIVVMECMYSGKLSVNMSPKPEHYATRKGIAMQYLEKMMQDRVWGSVPMVVAFAHLFKQPRPVRIYQILDGKLVVYQDIVPVGCSLPSAEEDDILQEDKGFRGSAYDLSDKDLDMFETSGCEQDACCDDTMQPDPTANSRDGTDAEPDTETGEECETHVHDTDEECEAHEHDTQAGSTQNFMRILFDRDGPGHYDALATKHQMDVICSVFPECGSDFHGL